MRNLCPPQTPPAAPPVSQGQAAGPQEIPGRVAQFQPLATPTRPDGIVPRGSCQVETANHPFRHHSHALL